MTAFSAIDHAHMARALRLAERGAYTSRPNPMVGCVIADGGRVLGEGFHERAGEPHAEVHALRAAGDAARGATAYVTLEPCAHHGRTPPCADALLAAGVARVVAAMRDPFTAVDGQGFAQLIAGGVVVQSGLLESAARELNRGFLSRVERGRPWLRVKLAMSLDGRTGLANGDSKWITSEAARADVQRWRARAGALLTASGTVLADDPHLTVRLPEGEAVLPPLRVVLDAGLATIQRGRIRDGAAPTLYLHAANARRPRELQDIETMAVAASAGDRLDLGAVLALLGARGINDVQVEAGATLCGALLAGGWVDELLLYVAPVLLGDRGRPLFGGISIDAMTQRFDLRLLDSRSVGPDLRLLLRPQRRPS